jgi:hypothetical protein
MRGVVPLVRTPACHAEAAGSSPVAPAIPFNLATSELKTAPFPRFCGWSACYRWLPSFGATSHKPRVRVRGLSRSEYVLPGASKKQSPPAGGIGSGMSWTLSLLEDVQAKKVNVVIVYKVDRLSSVSSLGFRKIRVNLSPSCNRP